MAPGAGQSRLGGAMGKANNKPGACQASQQTRLTHAATQAVPSITIAMAIRRAIFRRRCTKPFLG